MQTRLGRNSFLQNLVVISGRREGGTGHRRARSCFKKREARFKKRTKNPSYIRALQHGEHGVVHAAPRHAFPREQGNLRASFSPERDVGRRRETAVWSAPDAAAGIVENLALFCTEPCLSQMRWEMIYRGADKSKSGAPSFR